MRLRRTLGILIGLVVLLVGCRSAAAAPTPPTIRYGEDVSAGCGMIIDDPRFAVGALPDRGAPLLFDDIGDFLDYRQAHALQLTAVFVHDYQTKEWVRADDAWFVQSPAVQSPDGSGLAAFASQAAARQFQERQGGTLFSWAELLGAHRRWTGAMAHG
ncbi:MAG TPA: nitrous oxide reductase accessory protein NosL [Isosphaeraceae bacterium]|nr:nitrous oxide reductase accessory protein NosL [Isosphaeraceae bacterium]